MRSHSILKVTLVHFASVTETNKKKDQYHASILTFFKLLNRSTSILQLQFFHDMEAKPAKHSTYIKTCACDKLCQSKKIIVSIHHTQLLNKTVKHYSEYESNIK